MLIRCALGSRTRTFEILDRIEVERDLESLFWGLLLDTRRGASREKEGGSGFKLLSTGDAIKTYIVTKK